MNYDTENKQNAAEEEELIPVETPPEEGGEEDENAGGADDGDDEDEDEEDSRLAQSEDDSEEDISNANSNRARRKKRREMQRRAKEAAQRKLEMLEQQNRELAERLARIEGHTIKTTADNVEARLAAAKQREAQAEIIMIKAAQAGEDEDAYAAQRIRDEAKREIEQLTGVKQSLSSERAQPQQPDPRVVDFATQWMKANPWYDPNGGDRESKLTKVIDAELVQEGFNPASREYWEELTARVAEVLEPPASGGNGAANGSGKPGKRTGPPTSGVRNHAAPSTRKEIYVTPERKAAMIEAGVWDDPVQRQRYLKAYQAYDAGQAR